MPKMLECLSPTDDGSLVGNSHGNSIDETAPYIEEFEKLLSCLRKEHADLWRHCDRITEDNMRLQTCLNQATSCTDATTLNFSEYPSLQTEYPACSEVFSSQVENPDDQHTGNAVKGKCSLGTSSEQTEASATQQATCANSVEQTKTQRPSFRDKLMKMAIFQQNSEQFQQAKYEIEAVSSKHPGQEQLEGLRSRMARTCFFRETPMLVSCVQHPVFNGIVTMLILLNTGFMALEAEDSIRYPTDGHAYFLAANYFFTICFIVEIGLRLGAHRCNFFIDSYAKWNIFDGSVVIIGAVDLITITGSGKQRHPVTSLRILRALKMLRMLRIVKIFRSFRELRLITQSVLASVRTTVWCSGLIAAVTYMFSLFFMQGIADHLANTAAHQMNDDLKQNWETVGTSMYTLFSSVTGGLDWTEYAKHLEKVGRPYVLAFCFYIIIFLFVMANIITSLFVDGALRSAHQDDALLIEEHMQNTKEFADVIRPWFNSMSKDADGNVSVKEFKRHCHDEKLIAFAASLEVRPSDLVYFFKALSGNGKRPIDLETFVLGCLKLRGAAKSCDVMHILIAIEHLRADRHDSDWQAKRQMSGIMRRIDSHSAVTKDISQTLAAHTELVKEHHATFHNTRRLVNEFGRHLSQFAESHGIQGKSSVKHDHSSLSHMALGSRSAMELVPQAKGSSMPL